MMYAAENDTHHGAGTNTAAAAAANAEFDEPAPNLEVIYQAFGEHADLYKDVLQVKSSASTEQVQMAYFDRRSELFALLASIDSEEEQDDITASHRFHAERKMDAVVMAVRILGDPDLRQEYDNVMVLKKQTTTAAAGASSSKQHPQEPPSSNSGASRSSSTRDPDGVYSGVDNRTIAPPSSPHHYKSNKRNKDKVKSPKRRSPRRVSDHDTSNDSSKLQSSLAAAAAEEAALYRHADPDFDFILPANTSRSSKLSNSHIKKSAMKKKHQDLTGVPILPNTDHHNTSNNANIDASFDPSTLNGGDGSTLLPNFFGNDDNNTFADETATMDDTKLTWDDDGNTLGSDDWTRDDTTNSRRLSRRNSTTGALSTVTNVGFVSRIQEEVAGTFEDTLVSFEQVLNVFTLQDRDIEAVMGRIDKAKRQLRKRK